MLLKLISIYIVLLQSLIANAVSLSQTKPLQPSEVYTHSLEVDEDRPHQYKVFWKRIDIDKVDSIQFEIHCKTMGWVGMGLSPNGGMTGADIAIGWVKNGVGYLKDTHATGFRTPMQDDVQDYVLLDAAEFDGYTLLKFKRKLNTCDKRHDTEIIQETHYLIFAWNDADPVTGENDWQYHGANRLVRVELLLVYKDETLFEESIDVANAIAYDFRLDKHEIKPKQTYYYCQFMEVPQLDQTMHLIRYQMLVDKANKDIVHHLVVYECPNSVTQSLATLGAVGHECGSVRAPAYVGQCQMAPMIIAWGVGGQTNFSFPHNTGYPFYKSSTKRYLMFEYHYDNPRLDATRLDSSGVRLFLTPVLREHELGIIQLTSGFDKLDLAIPPRVQDLKISSICYPECFNKFAPVNGLKVFSGFMHTHLAGRGVRTKLVRNNKVIKYLFDNPKYDFNYQFNVEIEPEILRRGDELILECTYNTMDRSGTIYFGHSSLDEMCMNFMYYYPRVQNFELCRSTNTPKTLYDFIRQLSSEGLVPPVVLSETNINQSNNIIINFMNNPDVWTDELRQRYKEFYANPGPQYAACGSLNNLAASIVNLEKPFSLPFDEVAASIVDTCKAN